VRLSLLASGRGYDTPSVAIRSASWKTLGTHVWTLTVPTIHSSFEIQHLIRIKKPCNHLPAQSGVWSDKVAHSHWPILIQSHPISFHQAADIKASSTWLDWNWPQRHWAHRYAAAVRPLYERGVYIHVHGKGATCMATKAST
jgi:hypothetical protein